MNLKRIVVLHVGRRCGCVMCCVVCCFMHLGIEAGGWSIKWPLSPTPFFILDEGVRVSFPSKILVQHVWNWWFQANFCLEGVFVSEEKEREKVCSLVRFCVISILYNSTRQVVGYMPVPHTCSRKSLEQLFPAYLFSGSPRIIWDRSPSL